MGGGDLLNLLIKRDIFDEDFARFYIAEVRPRSFGLWACVNRGTFSR